MNSRARSINQPCGTGLRAFSAAGSRVFIRGESGVLRKQSTKNLADFGLWPARDSVKKVWLLLAGGFRRVAFTFSKARKVHFTVERLVPATQDASVECIPSSQAEATLQMPNRGTWARSGLGRN